MSLNWSVQERDELNVLDAVDHLEVEEAIPTLCSAIDTLLDGDLEMVREVQDYFADVYNDAKGG